MYDIRAEIPNVHDYITIRLKAGLSRKSEEAVSIGNSIFGVVVYHNDQPIGLGRIIGNHAEIWVFRY